MRPPRATRPVSVCQRDVGYLPREAMHALEAVRPEVGPGAEEVPPTALAPLVLSVRQSDRLASCVLK